MNHRYRSHTLLLTLLGLGAGPSCAHTPPETAATASSPTETLAPMETPELGLEYTAFTLDNGLQVIVHTDRKAPVVAVSVWYGVGSKDEPEGRTGFAHLFEHLMFNGSENYNDEWFGPLEEVGATGLNGTTWFDRTNYFETVPTPALERVLWMESDRMGHMLGAITQAKLDEQRGVVQNEKRQGDNQPYGRVEYAQLEGLFPAGHPYRHSTIGSMADLDAADLETVRSWFTEYYGAANAIVVLAGDIDAEAARPLMERYFGDIAPGPPLTRMTAAVPDRQASSRTVLQDRVPQARLYRSWAVPPRTERDAALLTLAAAILGDGKNARLYRDFVYDSQTATETSATFWPFVLTSMFDIQITLHDPAALAATSARLDALLAAFIAQGPTAAELQRARTRINAETVRGLEEVGGFSGKASLLAEGALYAGDPGFIHTWLGWINTATPQDVQQAAARWLADGHHQIEVVPYPERSPQATDVDRTAGLPAVGAMPALTFPAIEEARLSNGTAVYLARRPGLPVVELALQVDAGYAADAGGTLGAASFAAAMLDEGTTSRSSLEIAAEAEGLGARLGTGSSLDTTTISLSALTDNLAPSVALWADVVRNATFPEDEIERLRARWLAAIQQEKAQPVQLALRLLPPALYGDQHAYGVPLTGSGTEASIQALTRADLVAFRDTWLRPDNARILVVGDTSMDTLKPLLEQALSGWSAPSSPLPQKKAQAIPLPTARRVILIDRPGSPQSLILAGHLAPPPREPENLALEMANGLFGGEFSARINMNLREDKHWAYGAYSFFVEAREQRPWLMYAPVQADRTGDALRELARELDGYTTSQRPPTSAELERLRKQRIHELPGSFETNSAVLGSLLSNASLGRPLDHAASLSRQYTSLSLEQVRTAAQTSLHPEALVWIIVGDRAQIEDQIRALKWGTIEHWTPDGTPVD